MFRTLEHCSLMLGFALINSGFDLRTMCVNLKFQKKENKEPDKFLGSVRPKTTFHRCSILFRKGLPGVSIVVSHLRNMIPY